jgi:hypothetical protein
MLLQQCQGEAAATAGLLPEQNTAKELYDIMHDAAVSACQASLPALSLPVADQLPWVTSQLPALRRTASVPHTGSAVAAH